MHRRIALLVALVSAALSLGPIEVDAWTRPPDRLAGGDRYATAAIVATRAYPDPVETVIVASGESFADGLTAGPLAALHDAPVLLTPANELAPGTLDGLEVLKPTRAIVVGGPAAVGDEVLDQLEELIGERPSRVAGPTRYETATAVASLFPANGPVAFVASGVDFPDALAGGAAAAVANAPLLLVDPTSLVSAVGDELARLAPAETIVLGGTAAVSDEVLAGIDQRVGTVRRLFGNDRYATAAAIAADRAPAATEVILATGATFPDALAAAPLARTRGAPILLTAGCQPSVTTDYLRAHGWADVSVLGGTAAVPEFGLSLPCSPVPDGDVAPGVNLLTHLREGPNVARVITLDRSVGGIDVTPVTASGRLTGRLQTTEIARGNGSPIAVNGSFFTLSNGEPSFALARQGRLLKAPGAGGTMAGLNDADPDYFLLTLPNFHMDLRTEDGAIPVQRVNSGAPEADQVAMFTTEDPRSVDVAGEHCDLELRPTSDPVIDDAGDTVQSFAVDGAGCGAGPIAPSTHDIVTARANTAMGDMLADIPEGDVVTFAWRLDATQPGVLDVIGGNLALVFNGAVSTDVTHNSGPFFTERAPRTAIGVLGDGRLVLVVVDGRQRGYAVGWTPREFADFLLSIGVVHAVNLDGGGSTALSVHGVLANRPSDGSGQRAVGSAMIVDVE